MATGCNEADSLKTSVDLIDVADYYSEDGDVSNSACKRVAASLRDFGAVLVRDRRTDAEPGENINAELFRDMMERYFAQPREVLLKDARPEFHYQVGVTPNGVERPRLNETWVQSIEASERPVSVDAVASRLKDPKWRFFWRVGPRPAAGQTAFPQLNAPQIVPEAFENEWAVTMDGFGQQLFATIEIVSEMLAVGLGLPANAFVEKLKGGPHLLAPTGSDLGLPELGATKDATLAGYHYDLNFLTIHAPASFPGLHLWTRTGKRLEVVCPKGTLLVQAGAQLEYLTANVCSRGFHEVVVSDRTIDAVKTARDANKSLWRISSTLFAHIASDKSLAPIGRFGNSPLAEKYNILAGQQVAQELRAIALSDDLQEA